MMYPELTLLKFWTNYKLKSSGNKHYTSIYLQFLIIVNHRNQANTENVPVNNEKPLFHYQAVQVLLRRVYYADDKKRQPLREE